MNEWTPGEIVSRIILGAALLGALAVIWRATRRGRAAVHEIKNDGRRIRDSILGRPATVDSITGKELAPALPGIGQRMDTVERAVIALADQHLKLDNHEARLEDHAVRIQALEEASVERVVSRVESAQAWSAMEAAINSDPNEAGETEL